MSVSTWYTTSPGTAGGIGATGGGMAGAGRTYGHGIILKPVFEISEHLASGRLVPVLTEEPPIPIQMACLYVHRRHQDPKVLGGRRR